MNFNKTPNFNLNKTACSTNSVKDSSHGLNIKTREKDKTINNITVSKFGEHTKIDEIINK